MKREPGKGTGREEDSVSLHRHIGDIGAGFYGEGMCPGKRGKLTMHEKENTSVKERSP